MWVKQRGNESHKQSSGNIWKGAALQLRGSTGLTNEVSERGEVKGRTKRSGAE